MSEYEKARPVSGEIMAGTHKERPSRATAAEFTDADFEILGDTGFRNARLFSGRIGKHGEPDGMETLRGGAGAAASGWFKTRGGPAFWLFGAALVAATFWISGGHALLRHVPMPAGETAQPLHIGELKSRVENLGGKPVLLVEGEARNVGSGAIPVPPLAIAVIGNDGQSRRYFLGTNDAVLEPGERFSFSSRLEPPADGVKSVAVTFREGDH
ncbi:hypothetical protein [Aquamicrobium sp. LC103]|uniref:hypothetical protein n=1 Tax=Aquamicrobium sp. LC103 TaxID=1120658 RepID=UPI00063E7722|nr:hypothetical protein [Aquamicrobium sp. LC103]TKT75289.1 hypothetical protein XW59_019340 [Aquamicrobium sp. LC103]